MKDDLANLQYFDDFKTNERVYFKNGRTVAVISFEMLNKMEDKRLEKRLKNIKKLLSTYSEKGV